MLAKSVTALAVLAFAAHVSAAPEKMPYKPLMKMSIHQMFGVGRRQAPGDPGYQPSQSICGEGATCADACGAGYDTCASSDTTIHCYNPAAQQTCCPDNTGNSCDKGFYCTADSAGQTWCCPEGTDLAACAAMFTVTGSLVSETPKPTSSSASSTSSSAPITTAPSSSSSSSSTTTYLAHNTTTTVTTNSTSTTCTSTLGSSTTWGSSNTTTTRKPTVVTTTTAPSTVSTAGASTVGAAGALSLLAAAAFAALL